MQSHVLVRASKVYESSLFIGFDLSLLVQEALVAGKSIVLQGQVKERKETRIVSISQLQTA